MEHTWSVRRFSLDVVGHHVQGLVPSSRWSRNSRHYADENKGWKFSTSGTYHDCRLGELNMRVIIQGTDVDLVPVTVVVKFQDVTNA
jgi:hypothetical protein